MKILRPVRALPWASRALILAGFFALLLFVAWMVRRANEPAAVVGILIISGIAALYMSKRATRTLETLDWRFRTILFTTIASLVITLFIYAAGIWRDVATFSGAAFAAWFSGVLFFAFVGAVVAAVSVIQPEQESFDSRARILFRRQYGPHIDYIVTKLKSVFEQYAQETNTKFIIDRYHDGERKYRVRTQDETASHSMTGSAGQFPQTLNLSEPA